jgi:hypothetical protein
MKLGIGGDFRRLGNVCGSEAIGGRSIVQI